MESALKKGVILLVVLFLGFWLVQDPNGFAGSLKETGSAIWEITSKLFAAIISFMQSLTS